MKLRRLSKSYFRSFRMEAIFDQRYFDVRTDDGTLGDIWNAVGAIGASAVNLLPGLLSGGSSSGGPAKGLAAIQAAVNQALSSLNQILQRVTTGQMAPAAAASEAQRIANALGDPQYVYQAQRGNDAAALNAGKSQAAAIVAKIQAAAGALPIVNTAGTAPTMPMPGQTATPNGNDADGIDTTTLLIVAGMLAALLILK